MEGSTADHRWSAVDFRIMIVVGFSVRATIESLKRIGVEDLIAIVFFWRLGFV